MALLKLTALDEDDLEVVSAHMQDAIIRFSDIRYLKAKEKFAILANLIAIPICNIGWPVACRPSSRLRARLREHCLQPLSTRGTQ